MPGVGKTSIGKSLSKLLGIKHIDIDQRIESQASETIHDIIQKRGEEVFRSLEKKELKYVFESHSSSVISSGGGVVLDKENRSLIKNQAHGIHLKCNLEEIAQRMDVSGRPLLYNTNKKETLDGLWNNRVKLYQETAKIEIDISGLSVQEASQRLYNEVNNDNN